MSIFRPAEPSRPELPSRRPTPTAYAASERSEPVQTEGSKLIVGRNIKLKGVEITDCDTLVVEGRRSEEHTSELQSLMRISYAVFCLKKQTHPVSQNTLQKQK